MDGVLDLPDGRKLGYAQWGPTDASPLLYCHGFPSDRRELRLIQPALERWGVRARVVALSRPGYGPSTFQAGRSFLDWPDDVAEAAQLLGMERFAVLGVSGGCPYALACGYALPDRVTRIGIAVGIAPIDASGMRGASALSGPSAHRLVRRVEFGLVAQAFKRGREARFRQALVDGMGSADRLHMERPELQDRLVDTLREAFVQGGRAAAYEAGLYRRAWGFELHQLRVPTHLWYGGADETVPASAGRWLADRIPDTDYVLWPGHGHFTWMASEQAAEVVATTVGVS